MISRFFWYYLFTKVMVLEFQTFKPHCFSSTQKLIWGLAQNWHITNLFICMPTKFNQDKNQFSPADRKAILVAKRKKMSMKIIRK